MNSIQTLVNNVGGDYNLVERIGAGYIMNVISFGRFRLNTGVRFETTTENVFAPVLSPDDQGNFLGASRLDEELHLRGCTAQRATAHRVGEQFARSGCRMAGELRGRNSATWRQI